MRSSDVRCREPEPLYLNHSTTPDLTEAETRCSNRLLGDGQRRQITRLIAGYNGGFSIVRQVESQKRAVQAEHLMPVLPKATRIKSIWHAMSTLNQANPVPLKRRYVRQVVLSGKLQVVPHKTYIPD